MIDKFILAFTPIFDYLKGLINFLLPSSVVLPVGEWTQFIFLGFTDLASYLTFISMAFIIIFVHYKAYKLCTFLFRLIKRSLGGK